MKFRIAEFLQGDDDGKKFFIEKGTSYKTSLFLLPKTAWETIIGDDGKPLAYKTMDEAVITVKQLKTQLPIYHEIK